MYTICLLQPEVAAGHKIAPECWWNAKNQLCWDFPFVSQEQINIYNMHGYCAALVLGDDDVPP